MASGVYDLNPWRRILHNMKPKKLPQPRKIDPTQARRKALAAEEANRKKLSNIVNKILASKAPLNMDDCLMDNEESSTVFNNYNVYN